MNIGPIFTKWQKSNTIRNIHKDVRDKSQFFFVFASFSWTKNTIRSITLISLVQLSRFPENTCTSHVVLIEIILCICNDTSIRIYRQIKHVNTKKECCLLATAIFSRSKLVQFSNSCEFVMESLSTVDFFFFLFCSTFLRINGFSTRYVIFSVCTNREINWCPPSWICRVFWYETTSLRANNQSMLFWNFSKFVSTWFR